MVIKLKNQRLTINQLKSGKIQKNILSDTEKIATDLAGKWLNGQLSFEIMTSGSTGKPQPIRLTRKILEYSSRTSMRELDKEGLFKNTLLCIHPKYIGGMMVVVRALEHDLDLTVSEPVADPSEGLAEPFDLVSMVPIQIQTLLDQHPQKLSMFNTVLIGGAPVPHDYVSRLQKFKDTTTCYQTYGMTETASHIALKNLTRGDSSFQTLGDIQLGLDERQCLRISGTVTGNQWIQTNDIVEIVSENQFSWKGRADFVINTGGIKVHPETLEARLSNQISGPFFICGLPDRKLGEKVVLYIEGDKDKQHIDFTEFHKYERPKEIIFVPHFTYTDTGKINRIETIQQNK